jgi:peroxiredoxin
VNPLRVPDVTFHTRVRNDALGGPNPYEWKDITSKDVFAGKRVIVVGLPGAFTPSCSDTHLPEFEKLHDDFSRLGIDQIVCLSVNDVRDVPVGEEPQHREGIHAARRQR